MHFSRANRWKKGDSEDQPTVMVTMSTEDCDYENLLLPMTRIHPKTTRAVADSGCQSSLMGLETFYSLGLKKTDLVKCKSGLSVNSENIEISGAIFLRLSGKDTTTGMVASTAVQVYVMPSTKRFYLSRQAMRQLGIIGPDFPKINVAMIAGVEKHNTV
jgi:hypothetical protein